ncbi:MAG: SEL1-like repeat protein [Sulfuricaulis sp.]
MQLGSFYEFGFNRPKDSVTALAWYLRAAAQGNVLATIRSVMLEHRMTPSEIEAARELAAQLSASKKPASEVVKPAQTMSNAHAR